MNFSAPLKNQPSTIWSTSVLRGILKLTSLEVTASGGSFFSLTLTLTVGVEAGKTEWKVLV